MQTAVKQRSPLSSVLRKKAGVSRETSTDDLIEQQQDVGHKAAEDEEDDDSDGGGDDSQDQNQDQDKDQDQDGDGDDSQSTGSKDQAEKEKQERARQEGLKEDLKQQKQDLKEQSESPRHNDYEYLDGGGAQGYGDGTLW